MRACGLGKQQAQGTVVAIGGDARTVDFLIMPTAWSLLPGRSYDRPLLSHITHLTLLHAFFYIRRQPFRKYHPIVMDSQRFFPVGFGPNSPWKKSECQPILS